jgi:type IV secretory pathway VirB3-like protein
MARPAMMLGVPSGYFGFIACLSMIFFIGAANPLVMLIGVPFWLIGYLICLKDPCLMGIFWARISVIPISVRNKKYWKARSYLP